MSGFAERLLIISIKMDQSPYMFFRIIGKLLGIWPVWYAERLEKKYSQNEKKAKRTHK